MRLTSPARVDLVTGVPSTSTSPPSGSTRPRMSRRTVDLPEPLEPSSTWTAPGARESAWCPLGARSRGSPGGRTLVLRKRISESLQDGFRSPADGEIDAAALEARHGEAAQGTQTGG